jgi:hypothetical protein
MFFFKEGDSLVRTDLLNVDLIVADADELSASPGAARDQAADYDLGDPLEVSRGRQVHTKLAGGAGEKI